MKVKFELNESEIQNALKKAILDKFPEIDFYSWQIKFDGTTKFKKRSTRRPMTKIKAYVETTK